MNDIFKKLIDQGFEMQNQMLDFVDDLVKKGKIGEDEKTGFIKEVQDQFEASREKGEKLMNDISDRVLEKTPFATQNDIEEVRSTIEALSKRVEALEGKKKKTS